MELALVILVWPIHLISIARDNMASRNPVSTANLMGHPLHPILITLLIGFFTATLLFDLLFWETTTEMSATAALWLLGPD